MSLQHALQALFEEWTDDTWLDPIGIAATATTATTAVMSPMSPMWPSSSVRSTPISSGSEHEPEVVYEIYRAGDDDDQNSFFAIAFAEIEEGRRASEFMEPVTVGDDLLWAAFYRERPSAVRR
ncbi:hypothetical protein Q9L58_007045 [Maublancomyces gigas]|uniref:Uncharacterized protein n=1 Tax=Discina gigas TaxID=1032678 RepID=A0ABR3GDH4_9PEZI